MQQIVATLNIDSDSCRKTLQSLCNPKFKILLRETSKDAQADQSAQESQSSAQQMQVDEASQVSVAKPAPYEKFLLNKGFKSN